MKFKKEGGLRTKGYFKKHTREKPLITIVTVVYNGHKYLEETILSVINQKYNNIEFIIIDGESTDNTIDIIHRYEHAIDYWISEKDEGVYDAMNKASNLAKGEWISYMNCGDSFCNNEVIKKIKFNHFSRYVIIHGNSKVFSGNRKLIKVQRSFKMNKFNLSIFATGVACHQAVFYSKKINFNYPKKYKLKGELYSYFEYLKHGKAIRLDLNICNFFLGGMGSREKRKNNKEKWAVLKDQVGIMRFLHAPLSLFNNLRFYKNSQ
jgi:glycosyltransferase involved in cell wall biosynthesis